MSSEEAQEDGLVGQLCSDDQSKAETGLRVGVLDLRRGDLLSRHQTIRGALCVDGLEGLQERYSWLPPKTKNERRREDLLIRPARRLIILCKDESQRRAVAHKLEGWEIVGFVVDETDEGRAFWTSARQHDLVVEVGAEMERKPNLLFEPSEMARLMTRVWQTYNDPQTPTTCSVLDLGCGAGRDMAWIVRHGDDRTTWKVTGLDNVPSVVRRARMLVDEYGLGTNSSALSSIEAVVCARADQGGSLVSVEGGTDEKKEGESSLSSFASNYLPRMTYDVLLLVRFYPHELIHRLPQLSHVGSLIAIGHFTTLTAMEEQDQRLSSLPRAFAQPPEPKRFPHDHVDLLLHVWRALNTRWTVVHHSVDSCEDGRPLRNVIFRRID